MLSGFLLLFLLGFCWASAGAAVAVARHENCSIWTFYFTGSLAAALMSWGWLAFRNLPEFSGLLYMPVLIYIVAAAFLNALGQAVTMYNLSAGGRSIAFAIPQTCFLLPFVFAVFFWGERLSFWSAAGIICIAAAILINGWKKNGDTSFGARRLFIGIAAALIVGLSQLMLVFPSRMVGEEAAAAMAFRVPLLLSFSALFYGLGIFVFHGRLFKGFFNVKVYKWGVCWGIAAIFSYVVLFMALDLMSRHGQSGIVFAVACSVNIVLFALFSGIRMKERLSIQQLCSIVMIVVGIISVKAG